MRFDFLCETSRHLAGGVVMRGTRVSSLSYRDICVIAWVELHPYRRTFRDDPQLDAVAVEHLQTFRFWRPVVNRP
jgi:hypothetical protein